jgi:hypothetical protein
MTCGTFQTVDDEAPIRLPPGHLPGPRRADIKADHRRATRYGPRPGRPPDPNRLRNRPGLPRAPETRTHRHTIEFGAISDKPAQHRRVNPNCSL